MAHLLIGIIIGMFIGRFFRTPRECARVIRGYDCKGRFCDGHSDVAYYEAKYYEALDNNKHIGGPFNG